MQVQQVLLRTACSVCMAAGCAGRQHVHAWDITSSFHAGCITAGVQPNCTQPQLLIRHHPKCTELRLWCRGASPCGNAAACWAHHYLMLSLCQRGPLPCACAACKTASRSNAASMFGCCSRQAQEASQHYPILTQTLHVVLYCVVSCAGMTRPPLLSTVAACTGTASGTRRWPGGQQPAAPLSTKQLSSWYRR